VAQTLAWLEAQVRTPAGNPDSAWLLAHGLLAFGRDFQTSDGRSAVLVAAGFAEPHGKVGAAPERYGFAVERGGQPVEPHPYLLVKTFLEIGVDPSLRVRVSDGHTITLERLIADMRAELRTPESDEAWHQAAWWLTALALDDRRAHLRDAAQAVDRAQWREAALARLEADDSVIATPDTRDAFAPSAPMGAAKRNKTHIYGHPCGGLHFVQAVLRAAAASGSEAFVARTLRQLRLLLSRAQLEQTLYTDALRDHPGAELVVTGQQLKFFGHLLETLALTSQLGLTRGDPKLAQAIDVERRQATLELLDAIARLKNLGVYSRLPQLSSTQHQLYLDLIGDGCHAIHGLRATLAVLPGP
jgi:hypothetical protein